MYNKAHLQSRNFINLLKLQTIDEYNHLIILNAGQKNHCFIC
jgi:hypothetical protein